MRRLLLTTAIVTGALFAAPLAHAANTFTIAATLGENPAAGNNSTTGGPVITPGLTFSDSVTLVMNTVTAINTAGSEHTGFFTLAPQASCKGPSAALGSPGCYTPSLSEKLADWGWAGTETDRVTGSFLITDALGNTVTIAESGTFSAKYGGSKLPCAANSDNGNTDCFIWDGSTPANNGVTGSFLKQVTFSDGTKLDVTFKNAEDWDITPTLTFKETVAGTPQQQDVGVAEPSTIALLGLGLLGTLVSAKRKRG